MSDKINIKVEKWGKRFIIVLLNRFLSPSSSKSIDPKSIRKILVFRLDERIGNSLLLLPLLNSIKSYSAKIETHLFIHYPVAEIFDKYQSGQISQIWPYNQKILLHRPWKFLKLLIKLRKEKYDLILSCTNPDDSSTSQAILGKLFKGKILAGFSSGKETDLLYDIKVKSTTQKHYSDSMIDLWRYFVPEAKFISGGLEIATKDKRDNNRVLFWLGATGNKQLSLEIVNMVIKAIETKIKLKVDFALGPADIQILEKYPPEITKNIIIWEKPLIETALFFNSYKIFVSTDTGPLHLAASFNMPLVSIFTRVNDMQYGYNNGVTQFTFRLLDQEKEKSKLIESLDTAFEKLKENLNL